MSLNRFGSLALYIAYPVLAASTLTLVIAHTLAVRHSAITITPVDTLLFLGSLLLITIPPTLICAWQRVALRAASRQLNTQADLDPLTGLLNRPTFFKRSAQLFEPQANQSACTMVLLDIDHFTEFRESYGERLADRALQHISAHLVARVREHDLFCRIEGERFALMLSGVNQEQAQRLAERMLQAIAQRPFSSNGSIIEFSASCGFADTTGITNADTLYGNAKTALLSAKRAGYGKAVGYSESPNIAAEKHKKCDTVHTALTNHT